MYTDKDAPLFDQITRNMMYTRQQLRRNVDERMAKLTLPHEAGNYWAVASETQWHADDLSNDCIALRFADQICMRLEDIVREAWEAGKLPMHGSTDTIIRMESDHYLTKQARTLQSIVLSQCMEYMLRGISSGSLRSEMEERSNWLAAKRSLEWVGIQDYTLRSMEAANDILDGVERRQREMEQKSRSIVRVIEYRKDGAFYNLLGWNNDKSVITSKRTECQRKTEAKRAAEAWAYALAEQNELKGIRHHPTITDEDLRPKH